MSTSAQLFLLLAAAVAVVSAPDPRLAQYKYVTSQGNDEPRYDSKENDVSFWRAHAWSELRDRMSVRPIEGVAKNVILFLGDGMSIPTLTAARIYLGQINNLSGENSHLSFEKFPYTGLSKTYCVNKQVADSACSSTAYLGGVKANYGTMGLTASVPRGNCNMSADPRHHVDTVLSWAQAAGKATGIVTTTRITHASPAGHYAHTADRDWESDYMMTTEKHKADPSKCQDIARQLVENSPGKDCKVLLGGGRSKFFPVNVAEPAVGEGERRDGKNLVKDWEQDKEHRGKTKYVKTREELLNVDVKHTDYLLGLFNDDHLMYHLDEGSHKEPTLAEMTEAAIKVLRKEKRGFYLFVEGGKIDIAHHHNHAMKALDETVEFQKAVQTAIDMVDERDTLVVVTADHAHTMTISGYPHRGSDILGAETLADYDHLPYSTLSYANGPSAEVNHTGTRRDIGKDDMHKPDYMFPSMVGLKDETHGGDDVAVFARGPWAHLLVGNYEQTLIPHVISYAAGIGPLKNKQMPSSSVAASPTALLVLLIASYLPYILR